MAALTSNFDAGGSTCQRTIIVLFRERQEPYQHQLNPCHDHLPDPVNIKPIFCIQEPMPSVRRRCAKSPSDGRGTGLAVDRATTDSISRIALRWLNSSWSDVTAEMTSFYKQNFKHLVTLNCVASAKYSVADKERSTREKLDPVQPQHHEWRAQKFEELPEWRQGSYHWHEHVPSRKCYPCCYVTSLPCGQEAGPRKQGSDDTK